MLWRKHVLLWPDGKQRICSLIGLIDILKRGEMFSMAELSRASCCESVSMSICWFGMEADISCVRE